MNIENFLLPVLVLNFVLLVVQYVTWRLGLRLLLDGIRLNLSLTEDLCKLHKE